MDTGPSNVGFYADGRHEILNEREKDDVHRDVGHWLAWVLDR